MIFLFMESSHQVKLSAEQQELFTQQSGITAELLENVISSNADQLGYMLQAYYPGEKVSQVVLKSESIKFEDSGAVKLQLEYVMEQFNTCSAIDTEQKDKMTITVNTGPEAGILNLVGETWPEL